MAGRKFKVFPLIKRDLYVELKDGARFFLASIDVLCPECQSPLIGTNGTRNRAKTRLEAFQCKNPSCNFLKTHAYGKQFVLSTSYLVKEQTMTLLKDLYEDLIKDGAKNKTIAKKYKLSESLISHLRKDFEDAIDEHRGLDQLVDVPQKDSAIALDETFLKICGITIYLIIATGYTSKKTLALKVSETRNEQDMRDVFDEADRNTIYPISMATADGWGATQTMVKNLRRDFTLIIHKHKKPYTTAVIRRYSYNSTERTITNVGVPVDIFKHRKTRKYYYMEQVESLQPQTTQTRGRPKGVKNGQKKKKKPVKNKRGRKGLDTVFSKGKQGIVKIDPYRDKLKFGKKRLDTVAAALTDAFSLFSGKTIQNNLAENINSVLQSIVRLRGPKTIFRVSRCLRATLIVRNTPSIIQDLEVNHVLQSKFLLNNVNVAKIERMIQKGWYIYNVKKME